MADSGTGHGRHTEGGVTEIPQAKGPESAGSNRARSYQDPLVTTDADLGALIRQIEKPYLTVSDSKPAVNWSGMRDRNPKLFREYIDLRNIARVRLLPDLLKH